MKKCFGSILLLPQQNSDYAHASLHQRWSRGRKARGPEQKCSKPRTKDTTHKRNPKKGLCAEKFFAKFQAKEKKVMTLTHF